MKIISEKFVIEQFTSKNSNANEWIEIFEKECSRFNLLDDGNKIELLRLFMDKSCADWYGSMMIKLTMESEWTVWKTKFCETFENKGWNPVTYALLYKYIDGSLVDYAIKKEKLLLDMRRSIDAGTLIDLIAAGLPNLVLNQIDRKKLKDSVDLFNEIRKYEHTVSKDYFIKKKRPQNINRNAKSEEENPCRICQKLNKGNRYHAEASCWYKIKEDKYKKDYIKHVNNSVIETELNNTDQKNE